jgi:hypothetical protein
MTAVGAGGPVLVYGFAAVIAVVVIALWSRSRSDDRQLATIDAATVARKLVRDTDVDDLARCVATKGDAGEIACLDRYFCGSHWICPRVDEENTAFDMLGEHVAHCPCLVHGRFHVHVHRSGRVEFIGGGAWVPASDLDE